MFAKLNDPDYCIAQAKTMRKKAEFTRDRHSRDNLLKMAECYVYIAQRAEAQRRTLKPVEPVASFDTFPPQGSIPVAGVPFQWIPQPRASS
jgi:hypothetical protein